MSRVIFIVLAGLAVVGCGRSSAYQRVFRDQEKINQRAYAVDLPACWAAVNRAALALNFSVDRQEKERGYLEASRYFKDGKRTTGIVLKVNLQPDGDARTLAYVNAIQSTEKVFARSHTRFFLWIIPLPGGGGSEASRLKEGEWTVHDKRFYDSFFDAVDQELRQLQGA